MNRVIDEIDLDPLLREIQRGGSSSYHPRMLLKVLVYGYLCNIYSSRKIESAIKGEYLFYVVVSNGTPDHNTINHSEHRLKGVIKKVFSQV